MRLRLVNILFCFLFLLAGEGLTRSQSVEIEDYSYKEGLATSGVYSVTRDSKGFLWICSANGLFRFDGHSFRNINALGYDKLNVEVLCITETPDHDFLIGTSEGLFFFNAHTERIYPLKLDIAGNFKISQILIIHHKIWAASDIGLLKIDMKENFEPGDRSAIDLLLPGNDQRNTSQDNIVNTIYHQKESSSLWVGTNGALYEFDFQSEKFRYINTASRNSIRGFSEYHGNILVSSWDGGMFVIDPALHRLVNDPLINKVNSVIGDKRVMSAFPDNRDQLWVATFGNGLYIMKLDSVGKLSYENYRNNQDHGESLKSDFINQMYCDQDGIVWLSMNQPALSKVVVKNNGLSCYTFLKQNRGGDTKEILSVCASPDKERLWISTNGSGIYLFDPRLQTYRKFSSHSVSGMKLQSNNVTMCYHDGSGNLWIVYTKLGLYVVPSKQVNGLINGTIKNTVIPLDANKLLSGDGRLNSYITTFYEDSKRRLWVGGWGSLYMIGQGDSTLKGSESGNPLSGRYSTCIYTEDRKDDVGFPILPVSGILEINPKEFWLGTMGNGIIRLMEGTGGKFRGSLWKMNHKLPSGYVKLLYKDRADKVWVGTNSGLSLVNNSTGSIRTYTANDGLSSDIVNSVTEDNRHNIWVATSYGISEIQQPKEVIRNFYFSGNENYNQYITNGASMTIDGKVCFSSNEALVFVNPGSLIFPAKLTPVYFTSVKIDNNTVVPGDKYFGIVVMDVAAVDCRKITVPYNHTLSIEFAAPDFNNPGGLKYKYRIGNNGEWIVLNPNQRSLSIPNMKHGEYTLSVMAVNGQNFQTIRSVQVVYMPPFWLSASAYVIYVLVIMSLLLIYRRLLIQKILQKSILEKEIFERKKLEEMDKMKTEFFSNISHEFRTPLSLIINPLEKLMKDEILNSKTRERVSLVLKSSNRLLKLTNELMDFSKIEKNLLIPDFQSCEIVSFVSDICRLFDNMADVLKFDFKITCSFERLEIPIDKGMIEKVLFNLLSNAFKYTPANGMIMVNISKSGSSEGEFVKISVINTGEGIQEENLNRIFDRYYQVNNVQNRKTEGTGIGLAIVKSFVELHHGRVEVKSEPNLETNFDIYLPVNQGNVNNGSENLLKPEKKNPKDLTVLLAEENLNKKADFSHRILVVEDEEDIRNYIIRELSSEFNMLPAGNGEDGFKLASRVIPDVIITDVLMPVMSGLELCRKLRNQVITSHIPVLMLSAKAGIDEQIEGLEMGADVYMVKPFSIDHLRAQILRLIQLKQTMHERYVKEADLIPQGSVSNKLDEDFMQKVMAFIEQNLTNSDLNVDQLAACVSLSKVQTYRKIKAISGLSIVEFIRTIRLKMAAAMIGEGKFNFSEIAFETGFSTPSYFSKCFHDHFGRTPSEYAADLKLSDKFLP